MTIIIMYKAYDWLNIASTNDRFKCIHKYRKKNTENGLCIFYNIICDIRDRQQKKIIV